MSYIIVVWIVSYSISSYNVRLASLALQLQVVFVLLYMQFVLIAFSLFN